MDPNQTLRDVLEALKNENRDEAIEHIRNLSDWMERGGFMPDTVERTHKSGAYIVF